MHVWPSDSRTMPDGLLLLGFGGPTPGCCGRRPTCVKTPGCEAECFVAGILGDNPARMGRIDEVVDHYKHVGGGFSPYNQLTAVQATALTNELQRRGHAIAVECGFRHWTPWTVDGLRRLAERGCTRVALLVMAPHQSSVSWDWYLKHAAEASEALGAASPALVAAVDPWGASDGFIAALAARLREATTGWSAARYAAATMIFTAHAIPEPVARTSPYGRQFAETARLAAIAAGHPQHVIAYQSAPSDSRVPWTGPDIIEAVRSAAASGAKDVIVQAAGFLVDHTEVLYDLDIEAKTEAAKLGVSFTRATCVHDHPAFIAALADGVVKAFL